MKTKTLIKIVVIVIALVATYLMRPAESSLNHEQKISAEKKEEAQKLFNAAFGEFYVFNHVLSIALERGADVNQKIKIKGVNDKTYEFHPLAYTYNKYLAPRHNFSSTELFIESVKLLLVNGANPNQLIENQPILHECLRLYSDLCLAQSQFIRIPEEWQKFKSDIKLHLQIIKLLLWHNADVNVANSDNKTFLEEIINKPEYANILKIYNEVMAKKIEFQHKIKETVSTYIFGFPYVLSELTAQYLQAPFNEDSPQSIQQ